MATNMKVQPEDKGVLNRAFQETRTYIGSGMTQSHRQQLDRYWRQFEEQVWKNALLPKCTTASLLSGFKSSCELGLELGSVLSHAYLIPRKNNKTGHMEAHFQIGYKGLSELAQRSGFLDGPIKAVCVYSGDHFEHIEGTEQRVVHRPQPDGKNRNDNQLVAVYSLVRFTSGRVDFEVMYKAEIDAVRNRFAKASAPDTPWNTSYPQMACKTCIRRHCKRLPLTVDLGKATQIDESIEVNDGPIVFAAGIDDAPEAPARKKRIKKTTQAEAQAAAEAGETVAGDGEVVRESDFEPSDDDVPVYDKLLEACKEAKTPAQIEAVKESVQEASEDLTSPQLRILMNFLTPK